MSGDGAHCWGDGMIWNYTKRMVLHVVNAIKPMELHTLKVQTFCYMGSISTKKN